MNRLVLGTALALVFAMPAYAMDDAAAVEHAQQAHEVSKSVEQAQDALENAKEAITEMEIKVEEAAVVSEEMKEGVAAESAEDAAGEPVALQAQEVAVVPAVSPNADVAAVDQNWGYIGAAAAPFWGAIDKEYSLCKVGLAQSPVNIATFLQEDLAPLVIDYAPTALSLTNTGRTIQVNYKNGSNFMADGQKYTLSHFKFHTPSEHYLDGAPYPMEVQFVHMNDAGAFAVVSVMMKIGEQNPTIEGIWQNAPIQTGGLKMVDGVQVDAKTLMPEGQGYYKYAGSMTTPPCTENVQWFVMKEPIEVSEMQVKAFQALFPVNARPIQSLNDRVVVGN